MPFFWSSNGKTESTNSGFVDCTWPTHCIYLCHTHQLDAGQSHGLWMFLHVTPGESDRVDRVVEKCRVDASRDPCPWRDNLAQVLIPLSYDGVNPVDLGFVSGRGLGGNGDDGAD